jgi:hypothetical protein
MVDFPMREVDRAAVRGTGDGTFSVLSLMNEIFRTRMVPFGIFLRDDVIFGILDALK